jgi:predicted dehydrogenase
MSGRPVGVAVVGCGTISNQYLQNMTSFGDLEVLYCADIDLSRAKGQADKYGVPAAGGTDQALSHPGVEIVVNLTIPAVHASVSGAAIAAGKHVWTEKPLALDVASGRSFMDSASQAGLLVGCAPDTVLGAGLQTARRLILNGVIGEPRTALALLRVAGPERWHPDPAFLYRRGAGPLFDMGPYYLSALATIFGPASRVAAVGRRAWDNRVIATGPRAGTSFAVEVPSHVSALIEYASGPAATVVLSFDSPVRRSSLIEITGTEAVMALPDPNMFDGDIRIRSFGDDEWTVVPAVGAVDGRGLGVLDMARAVRSGDAVPRASGEIGLHVLDTMEAIETSAADGEFRPVRSEFRLPEMLEADWDPKARTLAA